MSSKLGACQQKKHLLAVIEHMNLALIKEENLFLQIVKLKNLV